MSVARVNFSRLPYLGAFALATDRVIAIADSFTKIPEREIRETLDVEIACANVSRSPLIGVLAAGNSNGAVVPSLVGTDEKKLERELGLKVVRVPGRYTALGNLILANDKGAVVNPDLNGATLELIEKTLDVPVRAGTVAGLKNVGGAGVATNNGALLHPNVDEKEVKIIEKTLKVPADVGTALGGVKYVGICIVANSNGALTGETTTGPELGRIENSLGFV
jgi:translation initiation factor 6